jgi:hypothetical protein
VGGIGACAKGNRSYNDRVRTRLALAVACVLFLSAADSIAQTAVSLTPDQQRTFLAEAKVIGSRPAGKGITGSLRLTLSDGVVTHDAGFQSIDDRMSVTERAQGKRRAGEANFVDSYKYNIAAYEIARLVGLDDMMPVTVERRWRNQIGSLSWWVDDVLMDETDREKSNTSPPNVLRFARQRQLMVIFAELLRDVDRNKGNIVYTKDWRLIMIDFSRAFRLDHELRNPDTVQHCDRALYTKLEELTAADVKRVTNKYLTTQEIAAVMARRNLIVARIGQLIRERGENSVLYDIASGM